MPVARIRTSDPEVIEFLSRHLADSGYQLECVRPEEPVQGEADLDIDASRMDLDSAMEAARNETGLVTILSGVLKAKPQRDVFEEAAKAPPKPEYAELSPYAQGAALEDEPSMLHKTVDALGLAIEVGIDAVSGATKSAATHFSAWKARRRAERALRRREYERKAAIITEQRRQARQKLAAEEVRRKDEEQRRRAEEERLAAIRREEMARAQAEQEHRRAEALAAMEIERQRQEERRGEEERRRADTKATEQSHEQNAAREEAELANAAISDNAVEEAQVENPVAEQEWHPVAVPDEPKPVTQSALINAPRRVPRPKKGSRDREFKRAGVAAAIVAAGIVSFWSLSSMRRPANPLSVTQLRNSAIAKQQRPFGPATAAAPVVQPVRPIVKAGTPARGSGARKVASRPRVSKPTPTKTRTANQSNPDGSGQEVIVRHFAQPKQQQATVTVKNGVKIISEN